MDKQTLTNILILVPCFLGLPIIGYQLYLDWLFENPVIWTESFTFFAICSTVTPTSNLLSFCVMCRNIVDIVFAIVGTLDEP